MLLLSLAYADFYKMAQTNTQKIHKNHDIAHHDRLSLAKHFFLHFFVLSDNMHGEVFRLFLVSQNELHN